MTRATAVKVLPKGRLLGMPNKRERRTHAEMDVIRGRIIKILKADNPTTVRQVFYRLVVAGVIEKTEEEYQGTVIRLLTELRLSDDIPFGHIVDESRRRRRLQTFDGVADALRDTAHFYRRSALQACPDYVELWVEKEALSGVIWGAASDFGVPVVISKGMPSLTQLYDTAQQISRASDAGKETYVYQFGDHDPSGVLIPKTMERRLCELCTEKLDCDSPHVERVALTEKQVAEFELPTRPTKRTGNSHAKQFEGDSVELDALPPDELRRMVRRCILRHINTRTLKAVEAAEESEREQLEMFAKRFGKGRK
jgi:hypothetical protein